MYGPFCIKQPEDVPMERKPTYKELEQEIRELKKELYGYKMIEMELRESEERLTAFMESATDGFILFDSEFNHIEMNKVALEITGLERKDVIGKNIIDTVPNVKETGRYDEYKKVMKTGVPFHIPDLLSHPLAGDRHIELKAFKVGDGLGIIFTDVTDRKQNEKTLRESEEKYRNLVERANDGVIIIQDGIVKYVNKRIFEMFGYTFQEMVNTYFIDYVFPDERSKIMDIYKRRLQGEDAPDIYEMIVLHKDGRRKDVETNSGIITYHGKPATLSFIRDITERKKAEKALQESEDKLRSIFLAAPTGIGMVSNRMVTQANDRLCEILGYSKDELLGQSARMLYPSDDDFEYVGREKYAQIRDKGTGTVETRWQRKDGKVIDVLLSSTPLDLNDQSIGVTFTVLDITERKKAEVALRESEERYRLLVENANEAIFIIQDGVVKFPNFKTEEMTGYSEKELSKIPFINIIHPDDREMVLERRRKRLLGEKPPSTYSFRMINKSGGELLVQINTVLITWEGNPATINFIRDITEQKRLETQLHQAQKMESIGTLAGGIAHDFNNLLMGIQGRTSLMLMDYEYSHSHFEHLKGIEDYVKSAVDLTKQLLGFAKGGKYEIKPTALNEFIKKQNRMFGRTRKEINIRGKYEKNLWTTEIDQGQIEQVLLNLYVNSWQAMPGGGDLYIQTENIVIDEFFNRPYHVEPGKYVKISVTDTGVGMDKATQQRIFDPFFTTKEMGRGTGLGLASAYGIIKNHGGFIDVYSEEGEGSTFNIYLPASEKEIVKEKKSQEEVLRGAETTLLVDDEDMIIEVGQGIIEKLGYKVFTAKSGKEAIEIYKKNHEMIDMVILDMIMPEMGGGETYDTLKEINPGIKVLLSSGYSIDGEATNILERGCNGFIQKPFYMSDLSKKIREILDKD
jgi:PAS domain S-box-containing protein